MFSSINFKHKSVILVLLFLSLGLSNCGLYKKTDTKNTPVNAKERALKNVAEGRSFSLGKLGKGKGGNFEFASSNPLWRASLEILDFTPLSNVDYAGGIIITDWFDNENDNTSKLKISIKFLSNEIRVDGMEVSIFEKKCKNSNCSTNKIQNNVSLEIKQTILKKAALLQKNQTNKILKEYKRKNKRIEK
tara:strand:+ start:196 stop:765 length:570 start_codon:yes stop_codon:yes gene_type:complete